MDDFLSEIIREVGARGPCQGEKNYQEISLNESTGVVRPLQMVL
jgi:hypothetical protein